MTSLPRFVVFYHFGIPSLPLFCSSADDDKKGHILRSEMPLGDLLGSNLREDYVPPPRPEDLLRNPDAKFELVPAEGGFVHIKSCLSDKYLRVQSESSRWIVAAADEPEEDRSEWSCTLFKPEFIDDGILNMFDSNGVQVNFAKPLDEDEPYGDAAWHLNEPGDSAYAFLLTCTDWETLVFLPSRRVTFKGDNGMYIVAGDGDGDDELIFSGSDPADEVAAGHQIFLNGDGSVCVKSEKSERYWCAAPSEGGRIVADGRGWLDEDCVFWPVKIDDDGNVIVIALRSGRRDAYLCRGASDDYLSINVDDTIVDEMKFTVEEIKQDA